MFLTYFCLSGLYFAGSAWFYLSKNDSELSQFLKTVNMDPTIVYVLCLLFGWIMLPLELVNFVHKVFTGKDIYEDKE